MRPNWMLKAWMQGVPKRAGWMLTLPLRPPLLLLRLLPRDWRQVHATKLDARSCDDIGCKVMPPNWLPILEPVTGSKYCGGDGMHGE